MSDLINRDSVLALAKDICVPTKGGEYRHRCIDPIDVMELPSANPEPTGTFGVLVGELGKGMFDTVTFDANGCVLFKKKPDKCDRCRFTFFEKGEEDDGD